MRETLVAAAGGEAEGPVRGVVAAGDGMWLAAMPAVARVPRPALGAKLVVAAPRNAARGVPTHRAVVVLFDPGDGAPRAWVDAEAITRDRTAAVSVVATQALAARPRGRHAILGAGVQGEAHLRAFVRAGLLDEVVVWSRTPTHAERLAALARELGVAASVAVCADEAVANTDVVTTCTASATPVFTAPLRDGAHVNAVGACVPSHREVPGALAGEASLVVDSLDAARRESGDVLLAVAEGAATWHGAVELGAVLTGTASPRAGRVSLFVSLGLGIEDVATASAVLDVTRS